MDGRLPPRGRGFMFVVAIMLAVPGARLTYADHDTDPLVDSGSDALLEVDDLDQLLEMADQDIGQLAHVRVTAPALQAEVSTVSRQVTTVGRSPAAVFVITNEMIRRSGARSLPEVLRMAPGVEVARIDSSKWAITIRGFNSRFSNKLLVQIDGRTVYTPLFGGVFWDVQDVVLEDIERIEVIRGPGATVWGANAVNGIINVLTKHSADSQGRFLQGGSGTEERGFVTARYGGSLSEDATYRVYGKWFDRDTGFDPAGNAHDDWRMGRTGFRMDWAATCCDLITFQGDYYDGSTGRRNLYADPILLTRIVDDDAKVVGGNALVRWTRTLSDTSDWAVQTYYDRTERHWLAEDFREDRDTVDVDFQHRFQLGYRHSVVWGLGYRNTRDRIRNSGFVLDFTPSSRADDLFSYFAQDEITLREDLWYLTVGAKFQHNDYTPFEFQPTARLLWTPSAHQSIWGAISGAARTPTRAEHNVTLTSLPIGGFFPRIIGNPNFRSEDLLAYELGIRTQPTDQFSWDLAVFYFDYNDLMEFVPQGFVPPFFVPQRFENIGDGEAYGGEVSFNYAVTDCWRLFGSYSFLRMNVGQSSNFLGSSPRNHSYLQSSWDLGCNWELDLIWRYVDSLPAEGVRSYNVADVRLAWLPTNHFEAAIVARHLLDSHHPEFGFDEITGNFNTEVEREIYGSVTWRY